jgi:hypothetical protein
MGEQSMKKVFQIIILMTILSSYSTVFSDSATQDEKLAFAISQAVLDGGASHGFVGKEGEPLFKVLIETHDVLEVKRDGNITTVWIVASSAVFRAEGEDVVANSVFASYPLMLVFKNESLGYNLITYNEPAPGSWSRDIREYFPNELQGQAFENRPHQLEKLKEMAKEYFKLKGNTALIKNNASFRVPISTENNDPARKAIAEALPRYPVWEGRSILTRSNQEQSWYYLEIEGDDGYYSPCRFTEYDKYGEKLNEVLVIFENGKLRILDGKLPELE